MITSTNENASSTSSTRPSSSLSEFNIQDANNHRGVLGEDSTGTSRQSSRSVTPAINVVYCENSKVERECTKRSASNHLDDQVCLLFCCIVILSIMLYHLILSYTPPYTLPYTFTPHTIYITHISYISLYTLHLSTLLYTLHLFKQNNNLQHDPVPKKRIKQSITTYQGPRNAIDASLSSSRRYQISQVIEFYYIIYSDS